MKKKALIIACVILSIIIGVLIYVSVQYNDSHILSKSLYHTTVDLAENK